MVESAHEALLSGRGSSDLHSSSYQDSTAPVEDDSYVEMRFTASCNGVLGNAKIFNDASFTFKPHEVAYEFCSVLNDKG